jgi:hypothetical protein
VSVRRPVVVVVMLVFMMVVMVVMVSAFHEGGLPRRQQVPMLARVRVVVDKVAVAMPNREGGHGVTLLGVRGDAV